ncbi:hypothetical protein P170DRAFT_469328 [Aspergillus steynii IBT 23096]|uniref:Uncharacterized protein n=1 Tax=Aspergillus steynii IBT 23096 TaxID=1392250 RepID=A0A2I2GLT3_9EURO|nr:uncharacterized protein P170DRAFT_469328 [Aspergillus steynii IBT 23096]PLB53841.1 hypothetical protein P170DRAFT_469328 [Aspergillus steynii IBT 23096]
MLSLLDFFATYVLHGRQTSAADQTPAPSFKCTRQESQKTWENELSGLMQRVHALHCRSRQQSKLGAHGITDAVQIWNDLASWTPLKEQFTTEEQVRLFGACRSAIFLWAYFLMHPDDMEGWKAQDSLKDILANVSEIEAPEIAPLLVIPLFFGGLTATDPEDLDVVNEMYEQLEGSIQHNALRDSWHILQMVWDEDDKGTRPSWDWIR